MSTIKMLEEINRNRRSFCGATAITIAAAQDGIKGLMARGFHKPGDVENRLGYYLGQIVR